MREVNDLLWSRENFIAVGIMFFQSLPKKFITSRILFQKAALLKRKNNQTEP